MPATREAMERELKATAVARLHTAGFKGSFPHFRRVTAKAIDLLTFQFDRHGGGLVIEIAQSPLEGITTHWRRAIPANKVRAWDLHPDQRRRIQPREGAAPMHGSVSMVPAAVRHYAPGRCRPCWRRQKRGGQLMPEGANLIDSGSRSIRI
jgi:Domain of unknown function (DUF4304)